MGRLYLSNKPRHSQAGFSPPIQTTSRENALPTSLPSTPSSFEPLQDLKPGGGMTEEDLRSGRNRFRWDRGAALWRERGSGPMSVAWVKARGGIWIRIAELDWSLSGSLNVVALWKTTAGNSEGTEFFLNFFFSFSFRRIAACSGHG